MSLETGAPIVAGEELLDYIRAQRWFAAPRGEEAIGIAVLDQGELGAGPPTLVDVLIEVRFGNGGRDVYQLVLGAAGDEGRDRPAIGGSGVYPAFTEAVAAERLIGLVASAAKIPTTDGDIEFCAPQDRAPEPVAREVRTLGVEQSNSSVVVDDELIVKLYRRLEAGVNPELELLRFLGSHGFANVPEVLGSWSYAGTALSATLGMMQRFIAGAVDGWTLAMDEFPDVPDVFLARVARLGEVIGEMHGVLASAHDDPVFAPEEASREALGLLAATVDDEIEEVFERLPEIDAVAPIAGCGDAVRDLLKSVGTFGSVGRLIRHHGDLHLGQVLWSGGDWVVVDFEGEPGRTLPERRAKRSPLRDVAGMLRSLSYAATIAGRAGEPLEAQARAGFLESYLAAVQPAAIMPSQQQIDHLITIFELEKAVYELRYELSHRPDWVYVPVSGIRRLLDQSAP